MYINKYIYIHVCVLYTVEKLLEIFDGVTDVSNNRFDVTYIYIYDIESIFKSYDFIYYMQFWYFQMVHSVGQHQRVPNVGWMRVLVRRAFLQGSKNTDRVLLAYIGRFVVNVYHYNIY